MAPRGKKQRAGKAKESPTSTEGEREIPEGEDEKILDSEPQEEVPKTEVDNGGEEAPPLKKARGRTTVKKAPGKGKGVLASPDEEKSDDGNEELPEDTGTEGTSSKATANLDNEEAAPPKKGRGRQKKVATKETSNGEGDSQEDADSAVAGAKKGRPRKKKVDDDEPEVMPKKKDRGAKKNEAVEEDVDEGTSANDGDESKHKTAKREKKLPVKKGGKGKLDEEDDSVMKEEGLHGNKAENGQVVDEQAEDEGVTASEEGAGDAKPAKKTARGKAPAKATDAAAKKKPAGRGKKATKGDELAEENDVPVDGKKLRVLVEHCKS